jgi:hypothetical protein
MHTFTINLSKEELLLLQKRGKKNFLSVKEQIEDILRRSIVSYKKRSRRGLPQIKIDDRLVGVFSRDSRGRKRKKKTKKK